MLCKYIRKEESLVKKFSRQLFVLFNSKRIFKGLKSNKFQNGEAQDKVVSKKKSVYIFYMAIEEVNILILS